MCVQVHVYVFKLVYAYTSNLRIFLTSHHWRPMVGFRSPRLGIQEDSPQHLLCRCVSGLQSRYQAGSEEKTQSLWLESNSGILPQVFHMLICKEAELSYRFFLNFL